MRNIPQDLTVSQHPLQVPHVLVLVAILLGLGESDPVDDGGVVELIGEDGVLGAADLLKQPRIGVKTGGIEDRVFASVEFGNLVLQLFVNVLGAANKSGISTL